MAHSEETRRKISASLKGRPKSAATRRAMREAALRRSLESQVYRANKVGGGPS